MGPRAELLGCVSTYHSIHTYTHPAPTAVFLFLLPRRLFHDLRLQNHIFPRKPRASQGAETQTEEQ